MKKIFLFSAVVLALTTGCKKEDPTPAYYNHGGLIYLPVKTMK